MGAWRALLNSLHLTYYHWKYYPGSIEYVALVIDVLLLAAIFWGAMTLVRRSGKQSIIRLARWVFVLALIVPINNLRLLLFDPTVTSGMNLLGALLTGLSLLIVLATIALNRRRMNIIRTAVIIVLILFPFTLITFAQEAWLTIKYRSNSAFAKNKTPARPLKRKSTPRVLWIVFDELDQQMAFSERPRVGRIPRA